MTNFISNSVTVHHAHLFRSGLSALMEHVARLSHWGSESEGSSDMKRILLAGMGMVTAIALWIPTTAGAAGMAGCYVGCVAPTSVPVQPPSPVVHAVSVTPPSSSTSSSLPFTGTDVIELAVIAMVLIALGWAMARRRRALG